MPYVFKSAGKMELVGITTALLMSFMLSSVSFSSSAALVMRVADKKFLRTLTHCVAEDFAEVAAVQIAESGKCPPPICRSGSSAQ